MGGRARPPARGSAAARFLHPEAAEIPHRQPIPVLEQAFRQHFVSPQLPEKKLEKLREKVNALRRRPRCSPS
jgi:hypothetical protein